MCLYMGSKYLYNEGLRYYNVARAPSNFSEVMTTMRDLSYTQALYYQSYMTDEQLANPNVHGTGIACFCLDEFFVRLSASCHP